MTSPDDLFKKISLDEYAIAAMNERSEKPNETPKLVESWVDILRKRLLKDQSRSDAP